MKFEPIDGPDSRIKIVSQLEFQTRKNVTMYNIRALTATNQLYLETRSFSSFQHFPFVEDFHGEHLIRPLHFDDAHFTEGASADHFDHFKVISRQS